MNISIETKVDAPVDLAWHVWTNPADIQIWNAASEEWHCPDAVLDLQPGGQFSYRMEAKDGSMGFDFAGEFKKIVPYELIEFTLGDNRPVTVEFIQGDDAVTIRETFSAESTNAAEQQRQGWQAILNNFAKHVESKL